MALFRSIDKNISIKNILQKLLKNIQIFLLLLVALVSAFYYTPPIRIGHILKLVCIASASNYLHLTRPFASILHLDLARLGRMEVLNWCN